MARRSSSTGQGLVCYNRSLLFLKINCNLFISSIRNDLRITDSNFPPQIDIRCLSLPDFQHTGFWRASFEHEALRQSPRSLKSDTASDMMACVSAEKINVELTHIFAVIDYEPERPLREKAPPKRFFRSFWRSITRRILERKFNTSMMAL